MTSEWEYRYMKQWHDMTWHDIQICIGQQEAQDGASCSNQGQLSTKHHLTDWFLATLLADSYGNCKVTFTLTSFLARCIWLKLMSILVDCTKNRSKTDHSIRMVPHTNTLSSSTYQYGNNLSTLRRNQLTTVTRVQSSEDKDDRKAVTRRSQWLQIKHLPRSRGFVL